MRAQHELVEAVAAIEAAAVALGAGLERYDAAYGSVARRAYHDGEHVRDTLRMRIGTRRLLQQVVRRLRAVGAAPVLLLGHTPGTVGPEWADQVTREIRRLVPVEAEAPTRGAGNDV